MKIEILATLSLIATQVATVQSQVAPKMRPNILVCIADDQSYPHAGAYGCTWVKTPAFDRVAREGILFTNAYMLANHLPLAIRWPGGIHNPETGYMDCDGSPTKSFILNHQRSKGESKFWDLNFGKHPEEELYLVKKDQECMVNLSDQPEFGVIKAKLVRQMEKKLHEDKDPRILGHGAIFDTYPYSEEKQLNYYNRWLSGEKMNAGWIERTDMEKF